MPYAAPISVKKSSIITPTSPAQSLFSLSIEQQLQHQHFAQRNATTYSPKSPPKQSQPILTLNNTHIPSPRAATAGTPLDTPPLSPSPLSSSDSIADLDVAPIDAHKPSAYSSASSCSFSTKFLTKQPRGFPQRSSNFITSPTSPSDNGSSPCSSASELSSQFSSASSSSSASSVSLDENSGLFSKLAELEMAVQAMAPTALQQPSPHMSKPSLQFPSKTSNIISGSSSALSTLVPTTPTSTSSSTLSSLALLSKKAVTSPNLASSTAPQSGLHHFPSDDTTPRIVRKKSGETVKSSLRLPSLVRHSSMPASCKMVHFDAKLEQVCHFLHSEKPTAVSASSSPVDQRPKFHWGTDSESSSDSDEDDEDPRLGYQRYIDRTEWQISLPNFTPPSNNNSDAVVYVENVFLTSDKNTLIGHVAVKNIAFEKQVYIKYTVDNWKTITELAAEYNDDVRRKHRPQGYDRFSFAINMADLPQHASTTKSLFFCVKYCCNCQDFWDNNNAANYKVDFTRVTKHKSCNGNSSLDRLPTRLRRSNSVDNPVSSDLDSDSIMGRMQRSKNQLASRYDFGASFSATSAAGSPAMRKKPGLKKMGSILPPAMDPKLALNAKSYQELIDSYCFFKGGPKHPPMASSVANLGSPGSPADQASHDIHNAHSHGTHTAHDWKKGVPV